MLFKVTLMKNLKLILKSLINNDACIEGGRKRPWWIAIIIFFISMILSVVPVFVQTITKKGASFVDTTYGYEVGARAFIEDINEKGLILEVKEQGGSMYLSLDQEKWDSTYTWVSDRGYHGYQHKNVDGKTDFEVFFIEGKLETKHIDEITKDIQYEEGGSWYQRSTTFLLLGSEDVVSYVYKLDNVNPVSKFVGDYKKLFDGYQLNHMNQVVIDGVTYNRFNITPDLFAQYQTATWNNWLYFFNRAYMYQRGQATWQTTLLMFGINAGITLFMGLMIFILTRGKYNPFKVYTIFDCMFIAFWATLAPAILTSGLGFLIKSFSQIIFPLLLGVRVMWLSMKSLRPDYSSQPQQSSKKEVKTVDVKDAKKKK